MNAEKTELVFILDRSGSMGGLESDTIGGFNTMLAKQKKLDGACRVTTILFDHATLLLHDRLDLKAVEPLTEKDYQVRGSTALYDAVVFGITKIQQVQEHSKPSERADKVIFTIITDGMENSSTCSGAKVREMIKGAKSNGWEFIFLGANIDAGEAAEKIGIGRDRAQDYVPDGTGTAVCYEAMDMAISSLRQHGCLNQMWRGKLDRDFKTWGKKQQ